MTYRRPNPLTITGIIVRETAKAIQISRDGGYKIWMPKSVITRDYTIKGSKNSRHAITVKAWFKTATLRDDITVEDDWISQQDVKDMEHFFLTGELI